MCDEQVHTLHCAHYNVYSKHSVLFSVLCYMHRAVTYFVCHFFKVSSVFVKMTTNKKHKFQFRKKGTNQNQKKEKQTENMQTKRDKRKDRRMATNTTKRFDTIIYHSKLLLFFALSSRMRAMHWCGPYSVPTVLCVQCF